MEFKMIKITASGITKNYGKTEVLNGVDAEFVLGKIYAVAGSNGCGKSTLMKILAGIMPPSAGTVTYSGADTHGKRKGEIAAYQPQNISSLFRGLRVREAIYYTALLRKIKKDAAQTETEELIRYFQIEKIKHEFLINLSGGEKQLTSICMTLIGNLPVLFFDEPTNNLDPERKKLFKEKLSVLKQSSLIIIITHDLSELEKTADNLILLKNKKIIVNEDIRTILPELDQSVNIIVRNYRNIDNGALEQIKNVFAYSYINGDLYFHINKQKSADFFEYYRIGCMNEFNIEISNISLQDKYLLLNGETRIEKHN